MPTMTQATPSGVRPPSTKLFKKSQHLQPFKALRTFKGLRRLMSWAAVGLVLLVECASSLPPQQSHSSANLKALAAERQQPNSDSSFLQLSGHAEPREAVSLHKSGMEVLHVRQQGTIKEKPAVDPFSAAQMLSFNKYKSQLRAQVHLHKPNGGNKNHLADTTVKREKATSLLARRQEKVTRNRVNTRGHERIDGGFSWIQLLSSARVGDAETSGDDATELRIRVGDAETSGDDATELRIPLRLTDSQVKSHFPVLSEFYAEEEFHDDDEEVANHQQMPLKELPQEKQAPAASLVQASSNESAKETSEEEVEPEKQTERHEQESTTEHGSAEESETKVETSKQGKMVESKRAATSKEGVHEEGGEQEATGKRGVHEEGGEREATMKAEENPNHQATKVESEDALVTTAPGEEEEDQPSVGELTQSLNMQDKAQKSEIVPLRIDSTSTGTPSESGTAKAVERSKREELQVMPPSEKHMTEPTHKKTQEEEREEHRRHTKELADRATKLANIQRMEVR